MGRFATILMSVLCVGAVGCKGDKKAGCAKDTDCKGKRICEKGSCVNPKASPTADDEAKHAGRPDGGGGGATAGAANRPGSGGPGGGSAGGSAGSPGKTSPSNPPAAGSPFGGPLGGTSGGSIDIKLKMCKNGKCKDLTQTLRSDPGALFRLFSQMMMRGSGSKNDTKLQVCVGGQCMDMGAGFGQNPQDISRMMRFLFGQMVMPGLWSFGRKGLPGGGGGKFPGLGRGGLSGKGRRPFSGGSSHRSAKRDPAGKVTYRNGAQLLQAGQKAVGKVAELKNLELTVVRDKQLVLKGTGKLLVLLDVPRRHRSKLKGLQGRAAKVTVRFYVTAAPLAKLVRGELIRVR